MQKPFENNFNTSQTPSSMPFMIDFDRNAASLLRSCCSLSRLKLASLGQQTLRTIKQESSFLSWSGKGVIVWYCFVNNKAHSLGIAVNSGFSSVKKGFLPWDARFFTAKTVAVTVSCRDHALWRRSSWQRRRLSQRWRRSSCRQRGKSPLRYSGLRQYLFATGDSPGVQLFQNVRIFRFSITKESCLSFFLPCLF